MRESKAALTIEGRTAAHFIEEGIMLGSERMDIWYFGGHDSAFTVRIMMLKPDGSEVDVRNAATGCPVDEVLRLIAEILISQRGLMIPWRFFGDFSVSVTSSDSEAKGRAVVRIQDNDVVYEGSALDPEISIASLKALVDALDKRARFEAAVAGNTV